jgi:hypothetical protein
MTISKQTIFKHGVSEGGELQVYVVTQVLKDGVVIDEATAAPYSPDDPTKMSGFDQKSIDIASAITAKTATDALKAEQTTPTGEGMEEIVTHDRTIDDLGRISVRKVTRIFDDGVCISKKYHRSWVMPGDDATKEDVMTKALSDKIHTATVITSYNTKMDELAAAVHV